jgi:hypothetical protein
MTQQESSYNNRTEKERADENLLQRTGISSVATSQTTLENRRVQHSNHIASTTFLEPELEEEEDKHERIECQERWINQKTTLMQDPASTIEQELVYRAKAEDEARIAPEQEIVVTKPPPDFRNFLQKLKEDRELRKRNNRVPIYDSSLEEQGDTAVKGSSDKHVPEQENPKSSNCSVPRIGTVDLKLMEQARDLRQSLHVNLQVKKVNGKEQLVAMTQTRQKEAKSFCSASASSLRISNEESLGASHATRNSNNLRNLSNFIESLIHDEDHDEKEDQQAKKRKSMLPDQSYPTRGSINSQSSLLAKSESELCIFEDSCHTIPSIPLPQAAVAPTNSSVAQRCGSAAWVAYQIESQMVDEHLH